MSNKLVTAEQVKEYLNIPDFRHLTKDKLIEFVSAIPDMDKEVAIKIIEQFPEFSGSAKFMVSHYETMCNSILKENGNSVQSVMDGYKQTLDVLSELAKKDDIDPADKRFFAEKMVEVSDRMASYDTSNKQFLEGIAKCFAGFATVMLFACATFLGVKISRTEIPHLE